MARSVSNLAHFSMPETTPRIAELRQHVGQAVTVRGWVTHVRSSGKVAFAVVRDGTGIMQAVFVKTQVPPEVWERFKELTLETSVHVTGKHLPARMKNDTPCQRHESISSFNAAKVSTLESGATPGSFR